MAKQTFTTGQVLTAAQMTSLQQTAMGGGSATAKTASYVLVAADAGTTVAMNAAGSTTITVNTGLFSAGDTVFIQNWGAGTCTITAGTATVSTHGSLALSQYEGGQLYFTSSSAAIFFDISQTSGMTNPMTTTGDTIYSSSGSTPARLGIGSTGDVLTVAGGVPTWAAPAGGGGLDLLSTTTMSGSTLTISSISSSYDQLVITINNAYFSTGSNGFYFQLRCNSDTGTNYNWGRTINTSGGAYNGGAAIGQTSIQIAQQGDSSTTNDRLGMYIVIPNYLETTPRIIRTTSMSKVSDPTFYDLCATYTGSSAISSLTFFTGTGTMTAGTIKVYGVK